MIHQKTSTRRLSLATCLILAISARSLVAEPIFAPDTSRISFQALLTEPGGDPVPDGPANLTFQIYETGVGLVEGPIPIATIVTNGVVNVMIPVSRTTWDGGPRELGVSVNGGAEMTPRIPLVSVPHAFRVDRVENEELTDDVLLGDSSSEGSLLVNNASGTVSIKLDGATGTIEANDLTTGTTRVRADSSGVVQVFSPNGFMAGRLVGDLAGGTFQLNDTTNNFPSIFASANSGLVRTRDEFVLYNALSEATFGRFFVDPAGGRLETFGGGRTTLLGSSFSGGGFMEIYQTSGDLGLSLDGDQSTAGAGGAGGAIRGYNTGGTSTFFLTADENGNGSALFTMGDRFNTTVRVTANGNGGGGGINLYNNSGVETAQLDGDADDAGELILFDASGIGTLLADADDGSNGARFSIGNGDRESMRFDAGVANGHPEIRIWRGNDSEVFRFNGSGANGDPDMYLRDASGTTAVSMLADDSDSPRVIVHDGNHSRIILDADNDDDGAGRIEVRRGNFQSVILDADGGGAGAYLQLNNGNNAGATLDARGLNSGGQLTLNREDGQTTVVLEANQLGNGGALLELRDATGTPRITLDTDVNGDGRVITEELQITGGSDLSEQFEIRSGEQRRIEPGMVVCIDPANPGGLVLSSKAHDRTVAGIVSGAGGVKTGMMMGQRGSVADGRYPVALTGRVYCKVDESAGSIVPGDLLTTANRAGCCMKVTDYAAAQGAIIGKAMTAPKDGLVLVLVSLQ